ncbi:protease pro-enzyme activation domain-containing protein [Streptacidiphilus monticola]
MKHTRVQRARIATVAAAALALASGSLVLASPSNAAAPAPAAKAVSGSHPAWATAAADQGAASAAAEYTATVYYQGQDPAGLDAYAKSVSDPNSAGYGKFLTPAQFSARFGATQAQQDAVKQWLTGAGLTIVGSTAHGVTVKGDNAALQRAFGTTVHEYTVDGKTQHAPATNVVVPASVSNAVLGVTGLSSATATGKAKPQSVRVRNTVGAGVKPADGLPTTATCSDYWGEKTATGAPAGYTSDPVPFDQCSFVPSQLRKAYGVTASGLTGKGATVAIVDAYGLSTMEQDANTFATAHGDKAFAPGQYTEYVTPDQWTHTAECGGPAGWAGEEALDVEMVHGLAPDAKVVYVGANSCYDADLLGSLQMIVDKHLADVVTNSWGEIMHTTDAGDMDPTQIAAYEQVFKQGAAEGIGFNFSAGDCGDESPEAAATGANCQTDTARAQADFPDSDPWVTSVGGTALGLASKAGKYGFETDMGNLRSGLSADGKSWTPFPAPFFFGGGGGTSEDFAQPWYQSWTVPGSLAHPDDGCQEQDRAARHPGRRDERRPLHLGQRRLHRRRRLQRGRLRRHQRLLAGVRGRAGRRHPGPGPRDRLRQPGHLPALDAGAVPRRGGPSGPAPRGAAEQRRRLRRHRRHPARPPGGLRPGHLAERHPGLRQRHGRRLADGGAAQLLQVGGLLPLNR